MKVMEIEYRGHTIEVHTDEDPQSPREWDNLGTMVCFHRRYNLGDEHPKCSAGEWLLGEVPIWENDRVTGDEVDRSFEDMLNDLVRGGAWLPLYLYDHSGITMRTGPLSCPWDSGQVGFIYVTGDRLKEEYHCKRVTPTIRRKAIGVLEQEVKVYDDFLTGRVYGYNITGGCEDSCWGFFGDDSKEYMMDEAKGAIDFYIKQRVKKHCEQVKKWITNHVPLDKRVALEWRQA